MVEASIVAGRACLVLDRTCFYPTGGGQPCDRGLINGVGVVEVYEEGGQVIHVLADAMTEEEVRGQIDWQRRLDHMQQHTGQHILSQSFLRLSGAETVSFHLGQESSTIDLDRETLSQSQVTEVEDLANEIVQGDRPLRAYFVEAHQLAQLKLRKSPAVEGSVRIVEVEGFDLSPCGGTHLRRTGELGLIKVRRWERRGRESRVEFLCGWRALLDYRWKNEIINRLALDFSVKDREVSEAVQRLMAEDKANRRELNRLKEELLDHQAHTLLEGAEERGGLRLVRHLFDDRDVEEVRRLALRLVDHEGCVALLGVRGEKGNLVFARSDDLPFDMCQLLKRACCMVEGSGGGRPHLAQGGGPAVDRLEEALNFAWQEIMGGK